MTGINFRNKDFLRLATVQGYASRINLLFKLQDMKPPINVADPNNILGILINNLVKEEDIARQRSPLDSAIFAELLCKLNVSCSLDSEQYSVQSPCSRLLHWSLCEQIRANYGQEGGLPRLPFQEESDQGIYCEQLLLL
jgi:hypothetical protein